MLEGQLILFFFSLFLDDGGDNAYYGKKELQRLDIFVSEEESISEAQSNVVDDIDSEDDTDDDAHF